MAFEEEREQLRRYLNGAWTSIQKPSLVERWEIELDAAYEELSLTRPVLSLRKLKPLVDGHTHAQSVLGKNAQGFEELYILHTGVKGRFPHQAVAIATEGSLLIDVSLPPEHRRELFRLVPDALEDKPLGKEEKHRARAREKLTHPYP